MEIIEQVLIVAVAWTVMIGLFIGLVASVINRN